MPHPVFLGRTTDEMYFGPALSLLRTQKHGMSASTAERNPQGYPSFPAWAPLSLKTREIRARLD
jgi:hypothetical protein